MSDNWDAKLYDGAHQFVSQYGLDLIKLLDPKENERILDAGCGTGDLTYEISSTGAKVVGVDHSEQMITAAKKKYPHLDFYVKDLLTLDKANTFDAVFSNAVLHWIKQPELALKAIYGSIRSGGRFVAEFGGQGNVAQITNSIIREMEKLGYTYPEEDFPWYYPSIGEYTRLMEKVGFMVVYAELIDRPTRLVGKEGLRNWLNMFATSFFQHVKPEQKELLITKIEKSLRKDLFHEHFWLADYKRIKVKAVKVD